MFLYIILTQAVNNLVYRSKKKDPRKVFSIHDYLLKRRLRINNYSHPQRSWGKVMFLRIFVILFTGGGLPHCMLGYNPPPNTRQTPPGTVHAGRYGQQAGGTHPTGMQSCINVKFFWNFTKKLKFTQINLDTSWNIANPEKWESNPYNYKRWMHLFSWAALTRCSCMLVCQPCLQS